MLELETVKRFRIFKEEINSICADVASILEAASEETKKLLLRAHEAEIISSTLVREAKSRELLECEYKPSTWLRIFLAHKYQFNGKGAWLKVNQNIKQVLDSCGKPQQVA